MNKHIIFWIIFGCLVFCQNEPLPRIAVLDFDNQSEDLTPKEISALSSRIERFLVKSKKYQVISTSERDNILKEQKFQNASGCVKQACAVEIGQMLGSELMISGTVEQIGSILTLTANMVNVETGKIEQVAEYYKEGATKEQLFIKGTETIVNQLTGTEHETVQKNVVEALDEKVRIIIKTKPDNARSKLFIDNVREGLISERGHVIWLTPGTYMLSLRSREYKNYETILAVEPGNDIEKEYLLLPKRNAEKYSEEEPQNESEEDKLFTIGGGVSVGLPAQTNYNVRLRFNFLNLEYTWGTRNQDDISEPYGDNYYIDESSSSETALVAGEQLSIGLGGHGGSLNIIAGFTEFRGSSDYPTLYEEDNNVYEYVGLTLKGWHKYIFWEVGGIKGDEAYYGTEIQGYFQLGVGLSLQF